MCVHGRVGRVHFWQLPVHDRFSLILIKKNDEKREGPTRMQPLHTATRALFCHERKQTGNKLKIYACTRAQFPVRQMDRPTVRLMATCLSVKPIVSLYDVTMYPIFLHVADRTRLFTDS